MPWTTRLVGFPVAAGALLLLIGACSEGREAGPAFVTRDSAGVRIAENAEAAVAAVPFLGLAEELRIGSADGEGGPAFGMVRDVALDGTGNVWVADAQLRTVHAFLPDGAPLLQFGGPGDGPGEFRWEILDLAVGGDTVLVLDRSTIHLFRTDGTFLHRAAQKITGNQLIPLLAHGPAGWVVGSDNWRYASDEAAVLQDTLTVWALDPASGAGTTVVAKVPGKRWYRGPDGRASMPWIMPGPTAALGPKGEVYVTDGEDYRIRVLSPEGSPLREVRADLPRPPLTGADADRAADRWRAYADSLGMPFEVAGSEASRAPLGDPDARPIPGRLLVAPDGRMLLERRDLDPDPHQLGRDDSTAWDLLDSGGRVTGRLMTDPLVNPRVFTADGIWAIVRDALDVQYVVRYGIMPAADAPDRRADGNR